MDVLFWFVLDVGKIAQGGLSASDSAITHRLRRINLINDIPHEQMHMETPKASGKSRFYLNLLIVAYIPFKLDK